MFNRVATLFFRIIFLDFSGFPDQFFTFSNIFSAIIVHSFENTNYLKSNLIFNNYYEKKFQKTDSSP